MVEKTRRVLGRIERRVLMDGAWPEALGGELGRGYGAGGEQERERRALLCQRRHERENGIGLTHAGGMKPGEPAGRPLRVGPAETLVAPQRVLFAAPLAHAE